MLYLFNSYRKYYKHLSAVIFICLLFHFSSLAQSWTLKTELLKYTNRSDSLINSYPSEKIYLQFDKPYYAINDTMWFKAYLLKASSLMPSARSGLLHIDINNDSGKLVKQYLLPVRNGISIGNIGLDEKQFKTGTYTLCAYTNWMRNFGAEAFFYRSFYITNNNENNWLVNTKTTTAGSAGKNQLNVGLQFNNPDKTPYDNKPLQLQVTSGSRTLYRQKVHTGDNGQIDVNFALPEKASGLAIVAESEQRDRKAVIPLNVNRPEKADIQFLPEGGNLIAGLPTHIGVKAIGEDGKGINISGIITDHNNRQVAAFQSSHNGMSNFYLDVQPGETYVAKVNLPGGAIKEYPLPIVKTSGTILQVKNAMQSDSLEIAVAVTGDIVKANTSYFLIAKARGLVCYAAIINFRDANHIHKKIAKSLFPSGITHFILLTTNRQPLNERLVFIDHHDELNIKITNDLAEYNPKDSIALHIQATDNAGQPVRGDFSLAITDDAQVKTDTLNGDNILAKMLLTSDLKGYVEEPAYYFQQNKSNWEALDNLLLTQGWVSYDFQSPDVQYQVEREFEVRGKVLNVFSKPVKGTHVILFSKSPAILMDTVTNNDGRFAFRDFPKVDTAMFVLKAVNKNGKSFNVSINIDEVKPAVFDRSETPGITPWYVNSDTTLLNYTRTNAQMQAQIMYPTGKHALKEVRIFGKKTVKGSQNLNGPGNADLVLDEKDMEAAGKKNWLQLLKENLPGFNEGSFDTSNNPFSEKARLDKILFAFVTEGQGDYIASSSREWYFIKGKPIKFIVDGTPVYKIFTISGAAFNDITTYLKAHTAEDLKGMEVLSSTKYAMKYIPIAWNPIVSISNVAFVEITTRSGHGPAIDNTPGMYLYKPIGLSWPKQFYKPKYAVNDTTKHLPDLRSTITWEPDIITDTEGKAAVWFYAADKPTTYTIILEGTDFNGNLGYKRQKITINRKAAAAKSK